MESRPHSRGKVPSYGASDTPRAPPSTTHCFSGGLSSQEDEDKEGAL